MRRIGFRPLPVAAALGMQFGLSSAWAAEECGPPSPGIEPQLTCSSDLSQYSSGITYLEPSIPHGLRLKLDSTVTVLRAAGAAQHGVDLATNGPNAIHLDMADGVRISTSGVHAQGVKLKGRRDLIVDSGANIDVVDPSATPDGLGTAAIVAELDDPSGSGDIVINQRAGSQLQASGIETAGILATHAGQGSVLVTTSGEIVVTGDKGYGVNAWGLTWTGAPGPSTVDVTVVQTETGRIAIDGEDAVGVFALNDGIGQAAIEIHGSVHATGSWATGLVSFVNEPDSQARATALISRTGSVHVEGDKASAVNVLNAGEGEVGVVSAGWLSAEGENARGVNVVALSAHHAGPAYAVIEDGSVVRASGQGSRGIVVESAGVGELTAIVALDSQVEAIGADSIGVQVTGLASGGMPRRAQVLAQLDGTVTVQGELGVGVAVTTDEGTASLAIGSNGRVTGGWQADTASTSSAHGMAAAGVALGSSLATHLTNEGSIDAGSDRAVVDTGRYATGIGNLTLENQGLITGFVELASGGQNRVLNRAGGELAFRHFADTDGDGVRDTKRVAISDFGSPSSRLDNQAGAVVRLSSVVGAQAVDATGFYLPKTGVDGRLMPTDVYDLNREGIVQAQLLNLGEFNHAGVIDLRGAEIGNTLLITGAASAALGPGAGVFVSNGGELRVRAGARSADAADPTDRYADMLIVDATRLGAGGATRIRVDYDPANMGHLTTGNGIELVEVRDKSASAPDVFTLDNRVVAGAYEYALYHGGVGEDADDGNWYLRSFVLVDDTPTDPDTPGDPDTPSPPVEEVPNYRKEVPVFMAVPALAQRLGLDVMGTYHDRTGEDFVVSAMKNAAQGHDRPEGDEGRAWGRVFGSTGKVAGRGEGDVSRVRWFEKNGPRYDFELGGIQLGLDLHRRLDDDGSISVAGAYLAASHATADVEAVSGGFAGEVSMTGYTLGAYWTHVGATGAYIDGVAQAMKYQSVSARSVEGGEIAPNGWGVAASLEAGYPFRMNAKWILEPQAQLILQTVSLDDTTGDRYAAIRYADSDAWYGRVGARLVRNWKGADGREYAVWGRANVWHDFEARAQTTFSSLNGQNAVELRAGMGGTWAQSGLGFNLRVQGSLNAFVAVDYQQNLNSSRSNDVSARIGLQYVW